MGDQHSAADLVEAPRVVLRPLGTPLPTGFIALAVATTTFATVQLGWIAADQGRLAAWGALALTVPLQALASVIGFLTRDPVAGTGMAVQAGTWAAVAITTLATPTGALSPALGVLLLVSAAAQLISATAALSKLAAAAVMGLSALRFAATGVAELTASHAWLRCAGGVGLLLGLTALYAALAFELEAAGHPFLPLGRRGAGRAALAGDASDQVLPVTTEAGVRRQL